MADFMEPELHFNRDGKFELTVKRVWGNFSYGRQRNNKSKGKT